MFYSNMNKDRWAHGKLICSQVPSADVQKLKAYTFGIYLSGLGNNPVKSIRSRMKRDEKVRESFRDVFWYWLLVPADG